MTWCQFWVYNKDVYLSDKCVYVSLINNTFLPSIQLYMRYFILVLMHTLLIFMYNFKEIKAKNLWINDSVVNTSWTKLTEWILILSVDKETCCDTLGPLITSTWNFVKSSEGSIQYHSLLWNIESLYSVIYAKSFWSY